MKRISCSVLIVLLIQQICAATHKKYAKGEWKLLRFNAAKRKSKLSVLSVFIAITLDFSPTQVARCYLEVSSITMVALSMR